MYEDPFIWEIQPVHVPHVLYVGVGVVHNFSENMHMMLYIMQVYAQVQEGVCTSMSACMVIYHTVQYA